MNSNPLLVKNFIRGEIPFLKDRSLSRYKKYIVEGKLNKKFVGKDSQVEVVSAYHLNPEYKLDFVFDKVDVTSSPKFSKNEWIVLGMVLRSYQEVEGVNLLHLYNCLYSSSGNSVKGYIVEGKSYTFYSSTALPVTIKIEGYEHSIYLSQGVTSNTPFQFRYINSDPEHKGCLKEIEIIFSGRLPRTKVLVEGTYSGISRKEGSLTNELVPESLGVGEYSDRLIEFLAGTLVTKLSNSKIRSMASNADKIDQRFHNRDGFYGKEVRF